MEHGRFYYRAKGAPRLDLGRDRVAALKQHEHILALRGMAVARPGAPISTWIDKYVIEHFPKLAEPTRVTRRQQLDRIRRVFGAALPDDVAITDVYAFKEAMREAPGQANGALGAFSHLYTKMMEWGGATKNPCFRIVKFQKRRRTRVPSIAELSAFVALAKNPIVPLYVQMKLAWGLRKKDMLDLPRVPLAAPYIDIEISKSMRWDDQAGKRVGEMRRLIITPAVREVIRQIYALPGRPHICQHLFSPSRGKRRGKRYSDGGFDSILETVHRAWEEAGGVHFREHDIRASTATLDPIGAKKRLGHKHQSTTDIYLRAFDIDEVQPLEITLTTTTTKRAT